MTALLRAPSPHRLLSLLPHLCGFVPRRSLVLVPLAAGRSVGIARLDLPSSPDDEAEVAATGLGLVCRIREASAFLVVVYADGPLRDDGGRLAASSLVATVRERADHCGLDVVDALCVGDDGWASYLSPDAPPRPLAEIDHRTALSPAAAARVRADQDAEAEIVEAPEAERAAFAAALHDVGLAVARLTSTGRRRGTDLSPAAVAAASRVDRLPELFEEAVTTPWPPDETAPLALLAWALARPALRDAALSQWSADLAEGYRTLAWNVRWAAGDRGTPPGPVRLLGQGPRPEQRRLVRALETTRRIAALAPARERAAALASAAWLSWALGNASHAARHAEAARTIEPAHGLADIVRSLVDARSLPAWAFATPTGRRA